MTAFVLGNGQSRRSVDLNKLAQIGWVYGCNALYREFTPQVLVATDTPIAQEIQRSGYAKTNIFYTRRPIPDSGAQRVPKDYFGFSSGPIAAALAAMDPHFRIYLVGFDLGPDQDGKFNNIYAGTPFYKPAGAPPTYSGNWIKQFVKIFRDFNQKNFIRVSGEYSAKVDDFCGMHNVGDIGIDEFLLRINTLKDL